MVCLGNICRSPLAEGILQSKITFQNITVDSAGTGAFHIGNHPDKRSVLVAKNHGIDIRKQRARQFSIKDFDEFDIIYAMDENNFNNILSLARTKYDAQKVKIILNEVHPNQNISVPDPYFGEKEEFENVFQLLDEACEIILKKITK